MTTYTHANRILYKGNYLISEMAPIVSAGSRVYPGQHIADLPLRSGPGTYILADQVRSLLAGTVNVEGDVVSVASSIPRTLPRPGDVVTGTFLILTRSEGSQHPTRANVRIATINGIKAPPGSSGVVDSLFARESAGHSLDMLAGYVAGDAFEGVIIPGALGRDTVIAITSRPTKLAP